MARISGVYVAIETFHVNTNGQNLVVRKGDLASAENPIRKAYPDYFAPVEDRIAFKDETAVEQATAAPGERRNR